MKSQISNPPIPLADTDIERAKQILTTESDGVIAGLMGLLEASQEKTMWQDKHTTSVLGLFERQLQNTHQSRLADIEARERIESQRRFPLIMAVASACAVGLSWVFLAYGQPQYVATVLGTVAAFAGGYGYGANQSKKNDTRR